MDGIVSGLPQKKHPYFPWNIGYFFSRSGILAMVYYSGLRSFIMFHPERKTHLLQPGANYTPQKKQQTWNLRHVPLAKGMKNIYKTQQFWKFHLGFGQLSHSSAKLVAQNHYWNTLISHKFGTQKTTRPTLYPPPSNENHVTGVMGPLATYITGILVYIA